MGEGILKESVPEAHTDYVIAVISELKKGNFASSRHSFTSVPLKHFIGDFVLKCSMHFNNPAVPYRLMLKKREE